MKKPVTEFQERVYAAARKIPRGSVTTYGRLAKEIGCSSARAVGQALRRNPFAPEVPCHRVVAGDLTLGGFEGNTRGRSVARKKRMLEAEGVRFDGERVAGPNNIYSFTTKARRTRRVKRANEG